MPGHVFVGQGLRVGTAPAVVVRFDRTGVVAAALDAAEAGASVTGRGDMMRSPPLKTVWDTALVSRATKRVGHTKGDFFTEESQESLIISEESRTWLNQRKA